MKDFKDYFLKRRTVRKFLDKKIPDSEIYSIIERAIKAPTCGNMQLYSVVITRDREMKSKLAPYHFNQPAATGADIILTICADFNRFTRWCELSDAKPGYDNFHSFMMAATDAIILAQQIVTIAETDGLGTCYLGTVNYTASQISELLELPDLVVPFASLALGYPEEEGEFSERLETSSIIHEEKYRRDSDEKIIEIFKVKDDADDTPKFLKENNKTSLAQVFTDVRYSGETNREVSKTFLELLNRKGFMKN